MGSVQIPPPRPTTTKLCENKDLENRTNHRFPLVARKLGNCGNEIGCVGVHVALRDVELGVTGQHADCRPASGRF